MTQRVPRQGLRQNPLGRLGDGGLYPFQVTSGDAGQEGLNMGLVLRQPLDGGLIVQEPE